jgi:hypothetical protein
MSSNLLRALHLTFWCACLALLLGLLGYALFFGYAFIVVSPLLLVGAIVGGAIGHGLPDVAHYAGPLAAYLTLCVLLMLLTGAVSYRTWLLLRPTATAPMPRGARRVSRIRSLGAAALCSPYLPRGWIVGSALAGVALGLAAWVPLADPVVGTVAPVALLNSEPDPTLVPQPTTEAAARELDDTIRPSAIRGDAYAQWLLGESLRNGLMGLTPDASKAGEWIAKSAAQGDPDGTLSLITGAIVWDLPAARDNALPPRDGQLPRLAEYAARSAGWRRVAAELMLARTANPSTLWLERAARHGSRHAAFQLARELEGMGEAPGYAGPYLHDAYAWFVFAGADFRVARLGAKLDSPGLARAQARAFALMDEMSQVLRTPAIAQPSADDVARLQRRAQMVGVRAKVTGGHDMRKHDAGAHTIAHAEATGDFTALAKHYAESSSGGSSPPDADLAAWLRLLAAKKGEAPAMIDAARLLGHSVVRVPKHVEYMYAWNALAAERLQEARSGDEAMIAVAIDGRDRARAELDPARLRDAEAMLAELRASVPSP